MEPASDRSEERASAAAADLQREAAPAVAGGEGGGAGGKARKRKKKRGQRQRKVVCNVHGLRFVFGVGDAQQSVRWLALAAAQRFAQQAPHGRNRTRESAGLKLGNFAPAVVRGGVPLDPAAKIADEIANGEEVTIDLQREVAVSERGGPVQPTWNMRAFSHSVAAVRRLREREAEEKAVQDVIDARTRAAQEAVEKAEMHKKQLEMRERREAMLVGKLLSKEAIENAVHHDWEYLQANLKITQIVQQKEEQQFVFRSAVAHFQMINDAFKHFSGIGKMGESFTMSWMEFDRFVSNTGVMNTAKDVVLLQKIFADSNLPAESSAPAGEGVTLVRAEFLESLLHLAAARCDREASLGAPRRTVAAGFEEMLDGAVRAAMEKLGMGPMREALYSDSVQMLINDNIKWIETVYNCYAATDGAAGKPTMNLEEFDLLMRDAGLMGGEGAADELTQEEARTAFSGAQEDFSSGNENEAPSAEDNEELTFTEFLEAMGRIAMLKWEDNAIAPGMKIELAIDALVALAKAQKKEEAERKPGAAPAGMPGAMLEAFGIKEKVEKPGDGGGGGGGGSTFLTQ